jgi:uncharacterized protein (DUF2236 family)
VLPPLTVEERERFYAESRLTAALFGIPQSLTPEHWSDFVAYKEAMATSDVLIVSEAARAIARQIVAPQGAGLGWPRWYRDLTAHLLPSRLREPFGLDYGEDECRRTVNCSMAAVEAPRRPNRLVVCTERHSEGEVERAVEPANAVDESARMFRDGIGDPRMGKL